MSFLDISRKYLQRLDIPFEVIRHKSVETTFQIAQVACIPVQQLVKTVLLADEKGPLLVSFAADQGLDFEALNRGLGRHLSLGAAKTSLSVLKGFPPMMLSPWHSLFGVPWAVDSDLLLLPRVFITSGNNNALLAVDAHAFKALSSEARVLKFARRTVDAREPGRDQQVRQMLEMATLNPAPPAGKTSLRQRLEDGLRLPVASDVTAELLALRSQEEVDVITLAHVVERDPVVSAQLIHHAASPFFGYQGALDSVKEAIGHVLGVSHALDIAIGVSMCKNFRAPARGPLGLRSLWRDALYSAMLSQRLGAEIDAPLDPGASYLCGLLHNLGYLVMAELFPKEYALLNTLLEQQPELDLPELEMRTLGVGHQELGMLLMDEWGLSDLQQTVARHHHDLAYRGDHEAYVHMICLVDGIMGGLEYGDVRRLQMPANSLRVCGLSEPRVMRCAEEVLVHTDTLDHMAASMVA